MKCEPYWWEDAPRPVNQSTTLPTEVDVVVIGSGYTGLHAAIQTARHGLGTLVLDADSLGGGCSSRNGGQVSTSVKGSYTHLSTKYGHQRAVDLLGEGVRALNFLEDFILQEKIACGWQRNGHFSGAHNMTSYKKAARALQALPAELDIPWHMIPRHEQHAEIATDRYHGGVVFPRHGALHPGKYHLGLLTRALNAGATAVGDCRVDRIEQGTNKSTNNILVHTSRGVVRAGQVALATNGYTGPVTPWHLRRIIPIGSYIIATERLANGVAEELSPHNRTMTDTRKLVFYYRLCPQRQRLLFGGRVALSETNPELSAPALHAAMADIFPQLRGVGISHSWAGFVGYTFDTLPHVGQLEGVHYAMGYCGSGISLASYCGALMGEQICGREPQSSVFQDLEFPTRPFYSGNPWFLKPSVLYYKLRDRLRI